MSKSKANIWILSVLGASLTTSAIAAKPAMGQEVVVSSNERDISLLSSSVSTKAIDLLSATQPKKYPINSQNKAYQLVQRELDLEKFCQDYPYNSQCSEPGVETDSSPIPVPGSPPAPSERTRDGSRSQNDQKTGWAIIPEISTLGLGGNVVRKVFPQLNARVGVNAFGLGFDITDTEVDYEGDLNLFNVSTLIDVYPSKSSGFRLSGGLIFGNNNIEGTGDISEQLADEIGEVEVGGQTLDVSDFDIDGLVTADADIDINNSVSPYLGIGGGNPVGEGKGLGFWWNLGVVFGGSPDIEITADISDQFPEEIRDEAEEAVDEVIEEQEEDIEDEIDFISIYPVVSLGFSYQF